MKAFSEVPGHWCSVPKGPYQYYVIMVEGGGEVHASVFEAGLSDEVCVFVAPKIAGGADARTPVEGRGVEKIFESAHLSDVTIDRIEDDVVIRGRTVSGATRGPR